MIINGNVGAVPQEKLHQTDYVHTATGSGPDQKNMQDFMQVGQRAKQSLCLTLCCLWEIYMSLYSDATLLRLPGLKSHLQMLF